MAKLFDLEPKVYAPVWNESGYTDECPIEKGVRVPTPYLCKCRHQNDVFSTNTEFNTHTKNKYHQTWLKNYHNTIRDDIELLNLENTGLKRDKAILHGKIEKAEARFRKEQMDHHRIEEKLAHENECIRRQVAALQDQLTESRRMYASLDEKFKVSEGALMKHASEKTEMIRQLEERLRPLFDTIKIDSLM